MNIQFIRRSLLSLLGCLFLAWSGFAAADAVPVKFQVPGYYRLQLGKFEVTALYDGAIELDTKLLKNTNDQEVQHLLARLFVKGPAVQTAVNAYLINTGNKLVLVDAGAAKLFGPSLGNIVNNLKAAGYTPEQVDTVLVTHLHGDHINGLIDAEGKAVFPHADIWSAKADNDFWLSEAIAAKAPKEAQGFFKMARDAAAPYLQADKWKTFTADQEILPGISSYAANGHTPGHSAYVIGNGEEKLLIWGDLVHNHAVQFARPTVAIEFDVDSKAAVATRKKNLCQGSQRKDPGRRHAPALPGHRPRSQGSQGLRLGAGGIRTNQGINLAPETGSAGKPAGPVFTNYRIWREAVRRRRE